MLYEQFRFLRASKVVGVHRVDILTTYITKTYRHF